MQWVLVHVILEERDRAGKHDKAAVRLLIAAEQNFAGFKRARFRDESQRINRRRFEHAEKGDAGKIVDIVRTGHLAPCDDAPIIDIRRMAKGSIPMMLPVKVFSKPIVTIGGGRERDGNPTLFDLKLLKLKDDAYKRICVGRPPEAVSFGRRPELWKKTTSEMLDRSVSEKISPHPIWIVKDRLSQVLFDDDRCERLETIRNGQSVFQI